MTWSIIARDGATGQFGIAVATRFSRVSRERWVHFRKFLPTRDNPAGITDRATIDAGIAAALAGEK